jgi:hypothetical protein
MEPFVAIFEDPGMTAVDYDAILEDLESTGRLYNENRISHVAFERKGSWCVVDVWNSLESFQQFAEDGLKPIFKKLGLNPPPPTVLPAHRYMGAQAEHAVSQ